MILLRLLNVQGIAGIAVSLALALLLAAQSVKTRHWKATSAKYELSLARDQAAFASTVAAYRAAADQARTADRLNATRVAADQLAISQRTDHDFETRLAAARLRAGRLRLDPAAAARDPRPRREPAVSGLSAAPGGAAQASGEDRLPAPDALIATEQAIQLDELVKWIRRQHLVPVNRPNLPTEVDNHPPQ